MAAFRHKIPFELIKLYEYEYNDKDYGLNNIRWVKKRDFKMSENKRKIFNEDFWMGVAVTISVIMIICMLARIFFAPGSGMWLFN